MATSLPVGDKIIVKGIPASLHPDKITIHFQMRKNGGGDVVSVTFPISSSEPDTAVVTFDDPLTVQSVLAVENHKIGGKNVSISALRPEPQVFDSVTATLSDFIVQCIISKNESDEFFSNVEDSTGCIIDSQDSKYSVKGKWYQVQAAFDRFQDAISDRMERPSQPSLNSYMERPSPASQVTKTPAVKSPSTLRTERSSPSESTPTPVSRRKPVLSTVLDKDIYAFMELAYSSELNVMRSEYEVTFRHKIMDDAVKIEVVTTSSDSEPQKALKALDELYTEVSKTVGQDDCKIDEDFPADELNRIFSTLRPEFPEVHMTKMIDNHVMFVAGNVTKCNMAKGMFEHLYQAAKRPPPGDENRSANDPVSTVFDKDIYGYMKLACAAEMDAIRNRFKVSFNAKIVNEAVKIEITADSHDAEPENASKALENLFSKTERTIAQDDVEIDKDFPADALERIFSNLRPELPMVHMDRMSSELDHIIIVAESNATCRMAIDLFKVYYDKEKESVHGGLTASGPQVSDIQVDNDVYAFIKQTKEANLNRIWNIHGVKITERVVDDCAYIKLEPKSTKAECNPEGAINEFQSLYGKVNESISQESVHLKDDFKTRRPTVFQANKAIKETGENYPDVFLSRMVSDEDNILFIAATEEQCNLAVAYFKKRLNTRQ